MIVSDQIFQESEIIGGPTKIIQKEKNVTKRVLGIAIQYEDIEKKQLQINKVNKLLQAQDKQDLNKEQLRGIKSFVFHLRVDFSESQSEYSYFAILDIVSLLGGLWATFESITARLGILSIIYYVFNLASMIRRKDQQKYRVIEIKTYMKQLPGIFEKLQKEIQYQKENLELIKDLEKVDRAYHLGVVRYDETIEKYELLVELLGKYYPEGLQDIFENHKCETEWEMLENFENDTKHQYFDYKRGFSLTDISDQIKDRMTFYSIYQIKDRNDMDHIKVKKLKYQLRNANDRLIELEKIVKK